MTSRTVILASVAAAVLAVSAYASSNVAATDIRLSGVCPAGFAPDANQRCRLVSLYRDYPSLQNRGMGGLKIGIASIRDGFTAEQADLGRYLFFDPLLSGTGTVSCASCHDPDQGFSDGRARSVGVDGTELRRSAPSLWNVGLQELYFWDARASSLEEQMQGPLYDPHEMGNTPSQLLEDLNDSAAYRELFAAAFPGDESIALDEIYAAIAAFEASLISLNSRYDLYAHGVHDALTANEIEGMNVFRSFVARCAECHTPPLFSNQQIAVIGTPEPDGLEFDAGREGVTGDASQRGGFKVPSLRNIAKTAPYMHSGRFADLRDAVAFYTGGRGHAVPEGESLSIHWHIWEPELSDDELDRLVDFLQTLTDESYRPRTPERVPSGLPLVHVEQLSAKQ